MPDNLNLSAVTCSTGFGDRTVFEFHGPDRLSGPPEHGMIVIKDYESHELLDQSSYFLDEQELRDLAEVSLRAADKIKIARNCR